MNIDGSLIITEIQRFCMHDGPGVRTTVFLKGCPLRCSWCHNPETQKKHPEIMLYVNKCINCKLCTKTCQIGNHRFTDKHIIDRDKCTSCGVCVNSCPAGALNVCGKLYTFDELVFEVEKDKAFYGDMGGVTLSGGEPFFQGKATVDFLKTCKERGVSTAVETCGYTEKENILNAVPFVDLFLWDIKDTDSNRHKQYTGVSCEKIIDNLKVADKHGAKTRLRCILVNGVNTNAEHYTKISELALSLSHCEGIELIPYHAYGGTKSVFIGEKDNGNIDWILSTEEIQKAKVHIISMGINVY